MMETLSFLNGSFENVHKTRMTERIAKRLARAGLCSRREAERWIGEGRVAVNGVVLDGPAFLVSDGDRVVVDGKLIGDTAAPAVWRYHKPKGLLTTHKDPEGRRTVFESLPKDLPRVISIGRLDINSEGLLLLTNHGGLARHLELPSTGWLRRYRVRAYGDLNMEKLQALSAGVRIEGVNYGPVTVTVDRQESKNAWLTVGINEGKNREVRRLLSHVGLQVSRLIRVSFGPFQLGKLPAREVAQVQKRVLREQLGQVWKAIEKA